MSRDKWLSLKPHPWLRNHSGACTNLHTLHYHIPLPARMNTVHSKRVSDHWLINRSPSFSNVADVYIVRDVMNNVDIRDEPGGPTRPVRCVREKKKFFNVRPICLACQLCKLMVLDYLWSQTVALESLDELIRKTAAGGMRDRDVKSRCGEVARPLLSSSSKMGGRDGRYHYFCHEIGSSCRQ